MSDFEREVKRNFRWNFTVNLVDLSFIMFGISLISRETVLPLLVSKLTDSPIAIGLIPAIYSLGIFLPQLIGAGLTESLPRKKPLIGLIGIFGERLPYGLSALAVLWLADSNPTMALVALAALLGLSGASAGFATPAWFDLIAKVIPVQRRGLFTGLSFGLGALMGVAGAAVIALVLDRWPFPANYALLYGMAFASMLISWGGLMLNREPASPSVRASVPLREYLRRLPGVLRSNQNFTRYIGSMAVVRLGTMAGGFFVVYGASRFQLGGGEVGLLTGILIGCQAIANPLWGMLGDRRGHKIVLVGGAIALALAAGTAWAAPSWPWLAMAFLLLGIFLAADSASFLTIIPEFCGDDERPTYIGLTNTLLAPVVTAAPLLGGWLAGLLGYQPMFAITMLVAICGAIMLARLVREPRRHRHAAPAVAELVEA